MVKYLKMAKKKEKNNITLSQYLTEEEIKGLKILIIFYSIFILCAISGFIAGKILGVALMNDWQFGIMAGSNILSSFYAAFTIYRKKYIFLAKYILFFVMAAVITLGMFWMGSLWIFLGYYLLTIMAGFFYNRKVSLFTGIVCFLFFIALILFTPRFSVVEGIIWLVYFIPIVVVTTFINNRNYIFVKNIVQKQEEVEETKTTLEIKITARTRELRELAESLDRQVKERTKELREKIEELERFNKLAVGRELKMVELKKEIKELKKEFGKKEGMKWLKKKEISK
jgi:signal transduction histidine kinase